MKENLSQEYINKRKGEFEYDKVFVKHLVKAIQKVDNGIGAIIYPHLKMVVFWLEHEGKNIIIHKVLLNKDNINDTTIQSHKEKVETAVRMIKLNLLPIKELNEAARQVKNANFKSGRWL